MKNIKAVTLVEIVISSLILAVVFAGLVAGFVSVRRYIARSQKRLTGTNFSRANFGMLTGDVNAITWATGNLSGAAPIPLNLSDDGVTYGGNITASTPPGSPDYRQVTVNVNFPID